MPLVNAIVEFIQKLFQWWFVVMPWEQAIHVRAGKNVKLRGAGLYLRIPFIDTVFKQTTRMRMMDSPMQTISTKDGTCITIKSVIGYSIKDVMLVYNTVYHPEMTLSSMSMGFIGEFVRSNNIGEITPSAIEKEIQDKIQAQNYGLSGLTIKIT